MHICEYVHNIYIYIYICICTCIYICMCMYIYKNMYMNISMNIFMHIYIYIYTYMYTYIFICYWIHIYIFIYMHTHTCIYMYMHTYMYICTYAQIHICIHTTRWMWPPTMTTSHVQKSQNSPKIHLLESLSKKWAQRHEFQSLLFEKSPTTNAKENWFVNKSPVWALAFKI